MNKENKDTAIYIAYDDTEPFDAVVPEKNLLKAILLTALSDLRKPGELGRKAAEYFTSKDETYIFSFVSVCDHLAVDPHVILAAAGLNRARNLSVTKEVAPSDGFPPDTQI